MVGLDAAGKTTILYKLKLGEIVTTIPTIGMDICLFILFTCVLFLAFEPFHNLCIGLGNILNIFGCSL